MLMFYKAALVVQLMLIVTTMCVVSMPSNIRLADGETDREGRVEVFVNGAWGTVCDDFWDENDAMVVCRSLGFYAHWAYDRKFGPGTGDIVLDDVGCTGDEFSLFDCTHNGLNVHNCQHYEDVGVECSAEGLRIVDGARSSEGRVELFLSDSWMTICDDSWDLQDANVVCRSLNFPSAIEATLSSTFGGGTLDIWWNDVHCVGNEAQLQQCPLSAHDCTHKKVAGVRCLDVRLRGSPFGLAREGRVEVYHGRAWGTVCDDLWSLTDADVVCRSLGFPGAEEATSSAAFGMGTGDIILDNVQCSGVESSLFECAHAGIGQHNCEHDQDAGVRCLPKVRMGDRSAEIEGRVEVYHRGIWGNVCADQWDSPDAVVVCRMLGFVTASTAYTTTIGGTDDATAILTGVQCTGSELDLWDCLYDSPESATCDQDAYAMIKCANVRLVGGETGAEGRVEVYSGETWGAVCDTSWDFSDAHVVCRSLGFPSAQAATTKATFGEGVGPILLDEVQCNGTEASILSCPNKGLGLHNCTHAEDAGARCVAVRLVNGSTKAEGRVEVFYRGIWGTVCDDSWDIRDATVVCKSLGFGMALDVTMEAAFGEGTGKIFLDDLRCSGLETTVLNCSGSPIGDHNCRHYEDAGVRCSLARLVGGSKSSEGRAEVLVDGRWGTICSNGWEVTDAQVLCGYLGYPGVDEMLTDGTYGEGTGDIIMGDVYCVGNETSLMGCRYSGLGNHGCDHSQDVSIRCSKKVRLVGGRTQTEGRVELYLDGAWSTLDNTYWEMTEAYVACKSMGFWTAIEAIKEERFGEVSGEETAYYFDCDGTETSLDECERSRHYYWLFEYAGVACRPLEEACTTSLCAAPQTEDGSDQCIPFVETCAGSEPSDLHSWDHVQSWTVRCMSSPGCSDIVFRVGDLNYNNRSITSIEPGAFAPFLSVENLYLAYNNIQTLSARTFYGLAELRILDLAVNNLTIIKNETFYGLNALFILDLQSNQIHTIESC